jgi:acetylornithine deacetylase/succinyl-diaminopimelate desuccinylase-like protein
LWASRRAKPGSGGAALALSSASGLAAYGQIDFGAEVTKLDPAWLAELDEFLRIPSVSADSAHSADVHRACEWVCDFVRGAGGSAQLVPGSTTIPLAVGEIPPSENPGQAPTVLIYGHFDVQPPAPLDEWVTPPFEPTVRDGRLYARGSADDKGQLYAQLRAAAELSAANALAVNVRVVCDGEEEIGGYSIVDFLAADERGADACVIFDGLMERKDVPSVWIATRGLVAFKVTVRTGERDLHSGVYGNAVLNAVHALHQALGGVLPREDGRLPAPLRDGAAAPTDEELEAWRDLPLGPEVIEAAGATPHDDRAADEFYLRTFAQPSVDVNGILGGKPGLLNTTIPAVAQANFTIRLAPGQNLEAIAAVAEKLLREAAPKGAQLEVELESSARPALMSPDHPVIQLALDALQRAVGGRAILGRAGGTLPILPALVDSGIPTVLTGFALPDCAAHSPNENLLLDNLALAIDSSRELYTAFAALR